MSRLLAVVGLTLMIALLCTVTGCEQNGDGPNHPTMDGKSVDKIAMDGMTDEEKAQYKAGVPAATGAPANKGKR